MEIIKQADFQFAFIAGRIGFPKHSLTLIVRGTYGLLPGKTAMPAEEQLYPSGDELYEDDDKGTGSSRYESDFAFHKPRADLLLAGKCYVSGGKPTLASRVTFQVGDKSKSLAVIGNRYWKGLMNTISDPEPFTEMELRYENGFGGEGYKKNPVGKGYRKEQTESGSRVRPLPNIEDMQKRIGSTSDNPEPAGFGPLGRMWQQRFSKMGTYKGTWLKERWPWFPKDFDWGHFNAAPPDMQVDGYLKGDEELYFENLHPVHSQYRSQLPGLRARLFINESDQDVQNETYFKEVKLNLDTLWVDMEAEKLVLVWRGFTEVKSEEFEEIQHVFIVSEKLDEPSQSLDFYWELFQQTLTDEEDEETFEPEPIEEEDEEDIEMEAEIAKAEEQMRASLIEAGIDPDNPPEPSEEDKRKEAEILKELGIEEEIEEVPLTREIFIERANKKESFEGEDLRGIDLSELDLQGLNFQNSILSEVSLKNSNLSGANLTEANLAEADLSDAKLNNVIMKETDLKGAILIKADLTGAVIEDAIFEKAKLNNALLNEVKGKDALFSEVNISEANFIRGDFTGCDFSNCNMDKADFQGSNLCDASVEGASGIQANMSETDLTGLKASEGCNFTKASFRKAKGLESIWENANLTEADFSYAEMEGANFSSALLEKANLYASNMKFARFTKANLTNAVLKEMNLFQGSFEKANLTNADCSGSNFYAAEFLDAVIKDTKFLFTNLKMTKLSNR